MKYKSIKILHNKYVKRSLKKAFVYNDKTLLCKLRTNIAKDCKILSPQIIIKTRVLKHMYDKRPAQEYDFLLDYMKDILRNPHCIYKNTDSKRGSKCFVKEIYNSKYLVVIEEDGSKGNSIVTAFSVDDSYLEKMEIVWHWEGGNLHRNT
jgi:hypothetical protein